MKTKTVVVIIFLLVIVMPIKASAAEYEFDMSGEEDIYSELYNAVKNDGLETALPEDAREFIDKYGITPQNPLSFQALIDQNGFAAALSSLLDNAAKPIKTASLMLGAILLCALLTGLKNDSNSAIELSFQGFSAVICMSLILSPIALLISDCSELLNSLAVFMNSLIPVFAGILIAAAKTGTALGFQSAVFIATQCVSFIGTYIVTPLSSSFLALSAAGGISGEKRLLSVSEMLKKCSVWVMSMAMTVYMSVFSIKNIITVNADNAGVKTARFLVSSIIPVVGASVNEALSSMKGCVSVLCRSFGIYAVIIMLCIAAPVLVRLIVWRAVVWCCSALSEMLGTESVTVLLKSASSAIMILTAAVICSSIMFIFSVTVLTNAAT